VFQAEVESAVESSAESPVRRDWLERLPKVELHLHLEGAIPHDALWQLICKYGGDASVPTFEALPGRFVYRDFPDFIDRWIWKQGFIREADDYELIGAAVARELARQRIVYAEAFFTPSDGSAYGLKPPEIAAALRRGLDCVAGTEVALICDVCRDQGPVAALRTVEEVAEVAAEASVIGIGMGGSEQSFPPEPFARVYERARALGFHTTAHAGEVAGPESIWGAIRALQVERIDHGLRAVEDPALVSYLVERRLPVTSCPGSNVATGAVASLDGHPIRQLLDAGVVVGINTDDPAMFGLSMVGELAAMQSRLGFGDDEVRSLMLNAVESCWLPEDRRAALRTRLVSDPGWVE
jgi:adenosine deaminase